MNSDDISAILLYQPNPLINTPNHYRQAIAIATTPSHNSITVSHFRESIWTSATPHIDDGYKVSPNETPKLSDTTQDLIIETVKQNISQDLRIFTAEDRHHSHLSIFWDNKSCLIGSIQIPLVDHNNQIIEQTIHLSVHRNFKTHKIRGYIKYKNGISLRSVHGKTKATSGTKLQYEHFLEHTSHLKIKPSRDIYNEWILEAHLLITSLLIQKLWFNPTVDKRKCNHRPFLLSYKTIDKRPNLDRGGCVNCKRGFCHETNCGKTMTKDPQMYQCDGCNKDMMNLMFNPPDK